MADVCVTVPKARWDEWIAEGDLPGDSASGDEYGFWIAGPRPDIAPGELVYIVAHGKLRGYAPLTRILQTDRGYALCREGGAVACTVPAVITGFRGWRYRWWSRAEEQPFPEWRTP